jgi:hypothetical protein
MPKWEYETEVLSTMVGRDKVRVDELDGLLRDRGNDGWELVSMTLDANLQGARDGHLLVFKRPKA